ncbi:unnamed protein product, partial [Nesidiocoris tenuis]
MKNIRVFNKVKHKTKNALKSVHFCGQEKTLKALVYQKAQIFNVKSLLTFSRVFHPNGLCSRWPGNVNRRSTRKRSQSCGGARKPELEGVSWLRYGSIQWRLLAGPQAHLHPQLLLCKAVVGRYSSCKSKALERILWFTDELQVVSLLEPRKWRIGSDGAWEGSAT